MRCQDQGVFGSASSCSAYSVSGLSRPSRPARPCAEEAIAALKKAASYYRGKVASHGGYVYYCSLDLKQRWGEGKASADTIFVQPPGTPTVGMAYLKAHEATGDRFYLDAARETAEALGLRPARVRRLDAGHSLRAGPGDWASTVNGKAETGTPPRSTTARPSRRSRCWSGPIGRLDSSTPQIHEAALYGLNALLEAQFPNGAFPRCGRGPVRPAAAAARPPCPLPGLRLESRRKDQGTTGTSTPSTTAWRGPSPTP